MSTQQTTNAIHTLDDIRRRKAELRADLSKDRQQLGHAWQQLTAHSDPPTRGDSLARLFTYGLTAFDAFMLVRKLQRRYGSLRRLFLGRKG